MGNGIWQAKKRKEQKKDRVYNGSGTSGTSSYEKHYKSKTKEHAVITRKGIGDTLFSIESHHRGRHTKED